MDEISHFHYDLAIHDLDIAKEYLKGMINGEYTGPHRTYASNINSATRFVHLHVWTWLPAIEKVERDYIPLLKNARNSIDENDPTEIKKHNPAVIKNKLDYPKYAMHVKASISSRINNLERYCKGLPSDFIPQEEKKRLEKLVNQTS